MTDSVLERQLARARLAYAASPVARFFSWWWGELEQLLPARARAFLSETRDEVLVALGSNSIGLERRGRVVREPVTVDRDRDADLIKAELGAFVGGSAEPPRVILTLPPGRVLRRSLTLPAAAAENLRQVLAFEMDRQTPFRADQVYFDQRVLSRDPATKQLVVEFAAAPRALVDAEADALAAAGLALDGVDIAPLGASARPGFNLLPVERRASRRDVWLWINLGLAALCALLLLGVMWQSVQNREAALEALEATVEAERVEAKAVADLRTELSAAVDGANFLGEKKLSSPVMSDLLLDLTRRLPADTWLQRFSLTGKQVQLQGQAREAATLIRVLQQSQLIRGPAIQGAVTPDTRTSKEQFLIQADALTRADPPPATPAATPAATRRPNGARPRAEAGANRAATRSADARSDSANGN